MLDAIEITTGDAPRLAVIWLHGLGADGHDFEPIVPELRLGKPVRFVFPHAPVRPVTINQGMRMRAWYDIFQFGGGREDDAGIRASQELIEGLIQKEQGKKIVLAGFSQGGAIVLQTALRHPERLAGVMALSTYLPSPRLVFDAPAEANLATPIFAAHGLHDDVVDLSLGLAARDALLLRGYPLSWHTYPIPHSVCMEEIVEIGAWLRELYATPA